MKLKRFLLRVGQMILVPALLWNAGGASAQVPEKVHCLVKEVRSREWYEGQIKAWKREVDKNPKDPAAWFNYYKANRMLRIYDEEGNSQMTSARFKTLQRIVDDMGKKVPESFEYNYVKWYNGSNDPALFPFLEKAYRIAPGRPETYADLATHYELTRDTHRRNQILQRWYASGDPIPGLLNYNYNVLMSLEENGILLTHGDNDTYPAWILQAAGGIRKDVTVLNVHLLSRKDYREKIFNALGMAPISIDPEASDQDYQTFQAALVQHIAANSKGFPVYLAVTASVPALTEGVKDRLYLVGLAYRYSAEKLDNIALLKRNFEQRFALDYLTRDFRYEPFNAVVNQANANYLVPMMHLYEHYKAAGEMWKAPALKERMLAVSRKAGLEQQVQDYFKNAGY
jgi:hypothetical protein